MYNPISMIRLSGALGAERIGAVTSRSKQVKGEGKFVSVLVLSFAYLYELLRPIHISRTLNMNCLSRIIQCYSCRPICGFEYGSIFGVCFAQSQTTWNNFGYENSLSSRKLIAILHWLGTTSKNSGDLKGSSVFTFYQFR